MENKAGDFAYAGNSAGTTPSLRQKAEKKVLEKEGLPASRPRAVSQEEMRLKVHELLVHQIELEMQNDELQRAQLELEEARTRYLDLYDLAPVGYCTLNEDGVILEANLTAARMLDIPRGALINQPVARFIHRDEQDAYYLYIRHLFETAEPQSFEFRMMKRGGSFLWVHLAANVMRNAGGELKCRITISDITERKLAEEALRESERLLRAIIDGTPDPIYLKDRASRLLIANSAAAAVLGLTLSEIPGKTGLESIPDIEMAKAIFENDRRIVDTDTMEEVEEILPSPEGLRTYLSTKMPWHDAQGKVIGLIGVARDITDRKNMEVRLKNTAEELVLKDKLITDFYINISHELKTPITLIKLAVEIIESYLKQPELNPAGIKKRIAIMKQNANRLSRLVGNILDITKIDAGFMEPKVAYFDIVHLIHGLVDSMDSFAQRKELRIEFTSSVKSKHMMADSQIVERVILNLVSNAIKHTQEGGCIQIGCTDNGSSIVFSVKDNGEGIPDEKKPIIFDRFRQVNTSLTRSSEGTGIGLSLTKALVELLHGRIWFESTLGVGSEFFVELPVLQWAEQSQPIEQNSMTIVKQIEMEFSDIDFG